MTRDRLTQALRSDGHSVSNARAGELLNALRAQASARINGTRPGAIGAAKG